MGQAKRRGSLENRIKTANFDCIICRENKVYTERSDEHVIPDALNGYYHIYNVCTTCNKDLGNNVDTHLIHHKFSEFYRFIEKIPGKSGKIPNPFNGYFEVENEPGRLIKADVDKKGELSYTFIPQSPEIKEKDGKVHFSISLDAKDRHRLPAIRKKFLSRNKLSENQIIEDEFVENIIENPVLKGKLEIDFLKFKIGLLKIAYEFAVDSIPSYFDDPQAKKISKILKDGNIEALKTLEIGNGLDKEILKPLEEIVDFEAKRHILILTSSDSGLLCIIKLDGLFTIGVRLSKRRYIQFRNTLIGINDLEKRTFIKDNLFNLFDKNTQNEYIKFKFSLNYCEIDPNNFNYVKHEKVFFKLFTKNGHRHPLAIKNFIEKGGYKLRYENNHMINSYLLSSKDLPAFVKSEDTGILYEITGFDLITDHKKV
ncbi:HNH endonuclease [Acinetobacter radioresistens]|jgi:hypothetical protein|uniref:HNH endonuclease n=1 Tax=Acinetobacter radioresistens TaxID=40216 RepID=UPI0002D0DB51|nr:HNH endonuclease [Acinetobacter radioresistens]ENV88197.1 hypothetical protein F940_00043 [Acinetobacter radioresistens NIPH 2130]MCK4078607.1 HNH endonuclease [Acinetobacter radioresistens]MCK4084897.1 HNH endonuclease [Acinetobacter radioresistens]MCK4097204.1 HNH endonuclease [Acinetobacter radioresistens]MCK4115035.1 HNH endonuclease [Acinetobacter radioresistens]